MVTENKKRGRPRKPVAEVSPENQKPSDKKMWLNYAVELRFTSRFAASNPKNSEEIRQLMESRKMSDPEFARRIKASEVLKTVEELAEEAVEESGATEEAEKGWATFKKDDVGLYYEARCVRAHLKDSANSLQTFLETKALKARIAQRVYVHPDKIYVLASPNGNPNAAIIKKDPDGNERRIVHAMTMKGPRSSIKWIDYVDGAILRFRLKVLNDGFVSRDLLVRLFEYGGTHGMGQERSQDYGRYEVTEFEELPPSS
jgi:DNA-binding transcriptional regulator YiaG